MLVGSTLTGVLALTAGPNVSFDENDRLVLELFAECAAPWVERAVTSIPSSNRS